jgi:hypothetical protein
MRGPCHHLYNHPKPHIKLQQQQQQQQAGGGTVGETKGEVSRERGEHQKGQNHFCNDVTSKKLAYRFLESRQGKRACRPKKKTGGKTNVFQTPFVTGVTGNLVDRAMVFYLLTFPKAPIPRFFPRMNCPICTGACSMVVDFMCQEQPPIK